jgi:protein farnesyltransferase/geranylgeranyltransferase type-1 subunit alpha
MLNSLTPLITFDRTYRKWLCRRFDLWEGELAFVRGLLVSDVRNNSAWTHRWLVLKQTTSMGLNTLQAELEHTRNAITRLPGYETNESAWNYLLALLSSKEFQAQHALVKAIGDEKTGTEAWARELDEQGCVQATAFLCDFFSRPGASKGHLRQALLLCVTLAQRDLQKHSYWSYRRQQIEARLVQDSHVSPLTRNLFAAALITVIVRLLLPTFVPTLVAVLLLWMMLVSAALSFMP